MWLLPVTNVHDMNENLNLYKLLIQQVSDYAIFTLDPAGIITSWNLGAERINGYSPSEIIGQHFRIFYESAEIARNWPETELFQAKLEGRFEDEGWRLRKDGSRLWANVIITSLRDENGTLLGYSKIVRDLTSRKNHEEALRQSEERFRLLVEGVQDYAIYMLSPAGMITSWNLGARRIKGYTAGEVLNKHFSMFYSAEDIENGKPWSELATARSIGHAEDEGWRIRKNGTRFWARVVVTPIYDDIGALQGFAKVTQDLTQRRNFEALEVSANKLNDFIAILAHELRNPLAPIKNAVQIQRISGTGDPAQKAMNEIIERQTTQLIRIVDDLLDVSRVTRGTMSIERKPALICSIVEDAVEAVRPAIEEANLQLDLKLPSARMLVTADKVRITQALTNLLTNAIRHSKKDGTIYIKVSFKKAPGGSLADISIRDTGEGITPDILESIFGMFVQGKNMFNRANIGLGVGLALARRIAELHHGTLIAKSDGSGKGAEFIMTIPAMDEMAKDDQDLIKEIEEDPVYQATVDRKRRIMVVDDNADAASVLSQIFSAHGHETFVAHNGADAMAAFDSFRPQVVLLDIGMPGMNGLEVARRIRNKGIIPSPLVIAVTGWDTPDDRTRSHDAGFDHHLVKPVNPSEILKFMELHSNVVH